MATIKVQLPDPIGSKGEITEIGIKEPRGSKWRELEDMGHLAEGHERSLILDIAIACSDPIVTPAQVLDEETGLTQRDIEAIDEAVAPFFSRGVRATGAAV